MTSEEMQQAILDLQENQKTITTENETLKKQLEEKQKREKELEEHNQKLFLKITNKVDTTEEKKEDDELIKEHLGEKVYNSLSNKDLERITEILNGEDDE